MAQLRQIRPCPQPQQLYGISKCTSQFFKIQRHQSLTKPATFLWTREQIKRDAQNKQAIQTRPGPLERPGDENRWLSLSNTPLLLWNSYASHERSTPASNTGQISFFPSKPIARQKRRETKIKWGRKWGVCLGLIFPCPERKLSFPSQLKGSQEVNNNLRRRGST